MGYSTPSVILQMIQNLKAWLMHHIGVLLFRRTSKGWRNGPKVLEINNSKGHILTMRRNNPRYQCMPHLESSLAGSVLGVLVNTKSDVSQQFAFAAKKAKGNLGCIRQECRQQVKGSDHFSLLDSGKTNLKCWVHYWAPQYERDTNIVEWTQQRGSRTEASGIQEEAERTVTCQSGKENAQRDCTPWWGVKRTETDFSQGAQN